MSYEVNKTNNFEKSEYGQINSKQKELINYYQKYDGKIIFYYIFPKLLYDDKFLKNKMEVFIRRRKTKANIYEL